MATFEKRRFISTIELRAKTDQGKKLAGLVKINTKSVNLGGFVEMLMPGAFDAVMDQDVRALKNHDENLLLGRTKSGTLRMEIDDDGNLAYEVDLPDTTAGRDVAVEVERRDIDATSFAFLIAPDGETWVEQDDGTVLRQIKKLMLLRDLSPVVWAAYPEDEVSLRSQYDAYRETQQIPSENDEGENDEDEGKEDPLTMSTDDDLAHYQRKLHLIEIQ